jgi:UDP:flavonoid glycosyltransferase YjiC (YdhE family)
VPIVGTAGWADQADNVFRAHYQGWGVAVPDLLHLTADTLYTSLMKVLTDPSYEEKAEEVAARLKTHPRTGLQQAGGA